LKGMHREAKSLHQVTADESTSTGYQNLFPLPIHSMVLYSYQQRKTSAVMNSEGRKPNRPYVKVDRG
jgi:hypothetical protein